MAIQSIDQEKCIGCGICVQACNCDVIRLDKETHKAVIRYQQDCCVCMYCEEDCPEHAIFVSPEKTRPVMVAWG